MRGRTILITGGTGSFGQVCVGQLLARYKLKRLIVLSRDEAKQHQMRQRYPDDESSPLRYFVGDVRDKERLLLAFKGVDEVIHAAALKQIPSCEYNPREAILTNVIGAQNVIEAAVERGVKKVMALSSDKAVDPINLYGATKLASEKLFVASNIFKTKFSIVRYGNVLGSRGSVLPLFLKQRDEGMFSLTDRRMTRFWITLEDAVAFVLRRMCGMKGGEIFVPKMPSCPVKYLINAVGVGRCEIKETGIRPGEKLHEMLISQNDADRAYDMGDYFMVLPALNFFDGAQFRPSGVTVGYSYTSESNEWQFGVRELRGKLESWLKK